MARKTATVTIAGEGRDKGKLFHLTEWSAYRAEKWAVKAFGALGRVGINVPPEIVNQGMAGLATFGLLLLARGNFSDVEPLMDEMLECIQIVRDPKHPNVVQPIFVESDIEEITTLYELRQEIFKLHLGFWQPASPSNSTSETRDTTSQSAPTSPAQSTPHFHPKRRA